MSEDGAAAAGPEVAPPPGVAAPPGVSMKAQAASADDGDDRQGGEQAEAAKEDDLPEVAKAIMREGKLRPELYPWKRPGWKVRTPWHTRALGGWRRGRR